MSHRDSHSSIKRQLLTALSAVSCTSFASMLLFSGVAAVRGVTVGEPTGGAFLVLLYGTTLGMVSAGPASMLAARSSSRPVIALLLSLLIVAAVATVIYAVGGSGTVRLSVWIALLPASVVAAAGATIAVAVRPRRRSRLLVVTAIGSVVLTVVLVAFESVAL